MNDNTGGLESPLRKTYSFTASDLGKVQAVTSPTIRKNSKDYRGTVYKIWNDKTGDSYVGKTVNVVRRIHAHASHANHPEKSAGRRLLAAALRYDPDGFRYTILKKGINPRELPLWEKQFIKELNPSLNMDGGGGGGGGAVSWRTVLKSR